MTDGPIYDRIGHGYDATRRAEPSVVDALERLLGAEGRDVLDLACGTANYTAALAARGMRVTGIDQSETMLAEARRKTDQVAFVQADANRLPFDDRRFGAAMCTLAIHHFPDLDGPFREVRRVLDGGRFVIFSSSREQMRGYWVGEYFPEAFRVATSAMPDVPDVRAALERSGFAWETWETWVVPREPTDLFLYSGKHRPELYFSQDVRRGISTFAAVADPAEVREGLARLRADIDSGRLAEVVARYTHDAGDYGFAVARAI